jgi:methionine sulfoxide reductase heme-binding subunit
MLPFFDRQGRFSWLKTSVLIAILLPACWILGRLALDQLGPKPINAAIHETGLWALRFLLLTLLITPLRLISGQTRLVLVRRMLGLASLSYTLAHLVLYVIESKYDLLFVGSEIIKRFYLTIGFISLLMLIVLGLTSTDRAIRRLGAARWGRLHRLVYPLSVLALIHAFMQAKIDVSEAVVMSGVFMLLMVIRLFKKRIDFNALNLLLLAIGAGLSASLIEAAWYGARTGAPPLAVLAANLDPDLALRPAAIVLALGLALPLLAAFMRRKPAALATRKIQF